MTPDARDVRQREIGGQDPLDRRLGIPAASPLVWLLSLLRRRAALGFAPALTPAVIFLSLGALLGPRVTGAITPGLRETIDVVVTTALTVLGVLVGTALGREIRGARRLFLAASLESAVTIVAVAGAAAYFVRATGMPVDGSLAALALGLGLCASASSATSADPDSEPAAAIATAVADLDDVLPIVLMMLAGLLLPDALDRPPWMMLVASPVIGLAAGAIGWLLFERAESGAERAVFVLGTLLLTGGAAAYVGVSPLGVGLVAGLTWTIAPGRADRIVQEDLQKVQHPVVVLLLVTAGAQAVPSTAALWLLTPYLLFRVSGKFAGAWCSTHLVDTAPSDLAAYLMSPGVLAIAFALNFRQMLPGSSGETLLSTVAIGTAAFELFALAVVPHWRRGGRT